MKTNKTFLLIISLTLFSTSFFAQKQRPENWCISDQHRDEMISKNPSLQQVQDQLEVYIANYKKSNPSTDKLSTIIIPVVVHNITHSGGQGFVSKTEIDGQIAQLNKDFNRTNSDASQTRALFAPHAAGIDIEFRLAHLDPNGNCTEGIVRIDNDLSLNPVPRDAVKAVSYWSSLKYFNIWVIDEISSNPDGSYVAGYAQFPGQNNNGKYGVVMVDQNFGPTDRSLTHELGHCFNLLHTFNYGSCNGNSDFCSDTPTQIQAFTSMCNMSQNTCGYDAFYSADVVDQIENFMSYASCQNMFTAQQKTRMTAILTNNTTATGVAHLSTNANLIATGVANPYADAECKPNTLFSANKKYICEGTSVNYTDESWGSTATSWNWTFNGGSPASGNTATPTTTYNNAGTYNTTLVAANAGGSTPRTVNNMITVSSLTADYTGVIFDGFESPTTFNNDWRIESDNGEAWNNTTSAAATGSRSVRLRNYNTTEYREMDSLISPSYNLSSIQTPGFSFKVAYKKKNSTSNDRLFVYYSLNCGESWVLKKVLNPSSMGTSPDQTSYFTPSSSSDWLTKIVDLSTIATETNVRFMFMFRADKGNNVYLDDININGSVGIDDFNKIENFNIFPNPTNSNAQVSFNIVNPVDNLSINVRNSVGQIVTTVINGQSFSTGSYNLKIDESRKLSKGIYFIEFNADNVINVQKLIIQ